MIAADIIMSLEYDSKVSIYAKGRWQELEGYQDANDYMDALCIYNGSSLKGCYYSSMKLLGKVYRRPIYIGGKVNKVFFPLFSITSHHNIWICYQSVLMNPDYYLSFAKKYDVKKERFLMSIYQSIRLMSLCMRD